MKKVAPIIEEKVAKLIEKLGQKSADRDGGEGLDASEKINLGFANPFRLAGKQMKFCVHPFFPITGISEFRKSKDFRVN